MNSGAPARIRWSWLVPGAMLGMATCAAAPASPAQGPLSVPFDFTRSVIEIGVTVRGTPLHMIVDTGVDPSIVDLAVADKLGLAIDRGDGGEASGFGDGKGAAVFPTSIDAIALAGRGFGRFDALATDMGPISAGLGRKLDGVLGYSFLADKIVLIDYPGRRLTILSRPADAGIFTRSCRTHWRVPLRLVDSFPIIPAFRFGRARAPVSLDTGSSGSIGLFRSALGLPGLEKALATAGTVTSIGARGEAKATSYRFDAPVGFGPFALPPGIVVSTYSVAGARDTRVANVGNRLLAAMKLRLLIDYPRRTMTFHGDCA